METKAIWFGCFCDDGHITLPWAALAFVFALFGAAMRQSIGDARSKIGN
jgi:hypothetical protein